MVAPTRRALLAIGVAGVAAGTAVLVLTLGSDHAASRQANAALNALIVWSFVTSGLVAWQRRPGNRVGVLMIAAGSSWFLSALALTNPPVLYAIGAATATLPLGVLAHLVLAFPEGHLRSRAERLVVGAAYGASVLQLVGTLFFQPGPPRPDNAFAIADVDGVATALFRTVNVIGVAVAVAVIVVLSRRWRGATAPARRAMAPVVWTGALAAACAVVLFASLAIETRGVETVARLATFAALALVPLAFLVGLLHTRLARSAVSRLVLDLSGGPAPGRLRQAIARALGDPSIALAYWLPETRTYVHPSGRPFELPRPGSGRSVTHVEREGRRVGVLVHDVSLADQRELVESVCAAAALALENERLQAELHARLEELLSSEERLRALIDASPLAIVEVDLEGGVTFWNRAAERLYGWTADEVMGQPISFVPHAHAGQLDELRTRMLAGESFEGIETVRLRKDGSLVDVVLSAAPVCDATGAVVRYMAVSADISERKRAQEELRRERDFISTLIDSTAALVIVSDRDGRFVRFNRACELLTGYSAEEVEGRPFWDLFIEPDEAESVKRAVERVWSGELPADNENHWILRDGTRRLIAWSNTGLLDADGNVELLVSSGFDITERKRVEDELRASEARFRELANSAPVMIWMADPDGTVTFFNQTWLEFTGRTAEQEVGEGWRASVHPEDADRVVDHWFAAAREGAVYEQEYRMRRGSDGAYRFVYDRGTPRFALDGSVAGYFGITMDISERKQWEEGLRASRQRILEAQDAARRRLERNLHDGAQQRLVALALGLRMAQAKASSDPSGTAQLLAGAADELQQAIEELRELARGIHPAVLTDRGLEAALEALAGRSPTPVEIAVSLGEQRLPPQVEAAAYYVVSEALANVAKYAGANGVTVSISREDAHACVEVADDGVGGASPSSGSGLRGLADRVEALEGQLEVLSPPGEGTRVRAQIPVS
jgi:PAS domain S-box-containing protein